MAADHGAFAQRAVESDFPVVNYVTVVHHHSEHHNATIHVDGDDDDVV